MSADRWAPIVTREKHCTHYIYPAAWLKLDYRLWWRTYRPVLMAAYPWHLTWREYLDRYRLFQGLFDALEGGELVGDR